MCGRDSGRTRDFLLKRDAVPEGVRTVSKKIYVGNLPYAVSEDELRQLFEKTGSVLSVRIITDAATGRPRGFGFVEMSDEDADKAITALNGTTMGDRTLNVSEARPQAARGRAGGGARQGRGRGDKGPGRWR